MNKVPVSRLEHGKMYVVRFRGEYVIAKYVGTERRGKRTYFSFRIGDSTLTDSKSYLQVFEIAGA